jgi:hypothetical protein
MAGKPEEPRRTNRSGAPQKGSDEQQTDDHLGMLAIVRSVKDDGRALTLYSDERHERA